MMDFIIIGLLIGMVALALIILYGCLTVASDYDDAVEKYWNEYWNRGDDDGSEGIFKPTEKVGFQDIEQND